MDDSPLYVSYEHVLRITAKAIAEMCVDLYRLMRNYGFASFGLADIDWTNEGIQGNRHLVFRVTYSHIFESPSLNAASCVQINKVIEEMRRIYGENAIAFSPVTIDDTFSDNGFIVGELYFDPMAKGG